MVEHGGVTFMTERHEVRNYNVGRLLTLLRPLSRTERAEHIRMIRYAPWGPMIAMIDAYNAREL